MLLNSNSKKKRNMRKKAITRLHCIQQKKCAKRKENNGLMVGLIGLLMAIL